MRRPLLDLIVKEKKLFLLQFTSFIFYYFMIFFLNVEQINSNMHTSLRHGW